MCGTKQHSLTVFPSPGNQIIPRRACEFNKFNKSLREFNFLRNLISREFFPRFQSVPMNDEISAHDTDPLMKN